MGVARVYKWELLKLLAQKRTYLGLGAAMLVPLVFVVVLRSRRAARTTSRSAATSATPGLATPFVVLFFMSIWALPADHGARRRRHRRRREPQRHAEDDPHALAQPRRDLRRQGARHAHLHALARRSRWRSSALVAGSIAWGFNPLTSLSGNDVLRGARARPARREPRALRAADGRRSRRSALLLSTVTRNSAARWSGR